jgi:photosystem II stability/assembly factor-like uncharacterized protein
MRSSSYPHRALLVSSLLVVAWLSSQGVTTDASASGLLRTPHSGWLWSDPFPQGNGLKAVGFAGRTGYAVGLEGTVLRSLDGGLTWTSLSSDITDDLAYLQVVNPEAVFAGRPYGCELWRSIDAGASFSRIVFDMSHGQCKSSLRSFWFLSATNGFVQTEDGALWWTENGGASFDARGSVPLFAAKPGPIEFLSPSVGFAVVGGEGIGRVMRTSDGGRSWTIVSEVHQKLSAVTFVTPLVGYVGGDHDELLRTEDGGGSWRVMPMALPPGTAPSDFEHMSCQTTEICLMSGLTQYGTFSDVVMRTIDGGRTAKTFEVPVAEVEDVSFGPPNLATAVGASGTAISRDNGATFTSQRRGVEFDDIFQQPRVRLGRSPLEAFIAAEHGQVAATSDGGYQWRILTLPTRKDVIDVAFPSPHRGFAVMHGGVIYRTDDGGRSWKRCGSEGHAPGSLLAPSARIVLVATGYGLWRSTNACRSFVQLTGAVTRAGHQRSLSSFDFYGGDAKLTRDHALIVLGNQVLESTDDGATWELIPKPQANACPVDVSFLSASVGYELCVGRIYFTRNRGRTWRKILSLPANELAEPPVMSFSNVRDGFVATRYVNEEAGNIVFRTEDAGRSWIPEQLPKNIGAVTASPQLAYAVREGGGEVFITMDGGFIGSPSRLTLAIAGSATRTARALARSHERVTVRGVLSPAVADATIHVSWLRAGGAWNEETTSTDANGAFAFTANEISSTTWFVANWNGDDIHRGAGTAPVRLTVRR